MTNTSYPKYLTKELLYVDDQGTLVCNFPYSWVTSGCWRTERRGFVVPPRRIGAEHRWTNKRRGRRRRPRRRSSDRPMQSAHSYEKPHRRPTGMGDRGKRGGPTSIVVDGEQNSFFFFFLAIPSNAAFSQCVCYTNCILYHNPVNTICFWLKPQLQPPVQTFRRKVPTFLWSKASAEWPLPSSVTARPTNHGPETEAMDGPRPQRTS